MAGVYISRTLLVNLAKNLGFHVPSDIIRIGDGKYRSKRSDCSVLESCCIDNVSKKKLLNLQYLRWPIYVINSVDITKHPVILSHRHSITVSLETYPFIHWPQQLFVPTHMHTMMTQPVQAPPSLQWVTISLLRVTTRHHPLMRHLIQMCILHLRYNDKSFRWRPAH